MYTLRGAVKLSMITRHSNSRSVLDIATPAQNVKCDISNPCNFLPMVWINVLEIREPFSRQITSFKSDNLFYF